jgi:hypothetical protein
MCGMAEIIIFNNKPVLTEQLKQITDIIALKKVSIFILLQK